MDQFESQDGPVEKHEFKLSDHIAGEQLHPTILLPSESDVLVKVEYDVGTFTLEIYGHMGDQTSNFYRIDYNLINNTLDQTRLDRIKYHHNLHREMVKISDFIPYGIYTDRWDDMKIYES